MARGKSKIYQEAATLYDRQSQYPLADAVGILKKNAFTEI